MNGRIWSTAKEAPTYDKIQYTEIIQDFIHLANDVATMCLQKELALSLVLFHPNLNFFA